MFLPSAYYIFSQGTLCTFFSDGKLAFRCAFLGTQGFRWTLFRLPVGVEGSLFLDCSVKLSWALSARETKGDLSDCFPNDRQAEHGQRKQPCVSIYSSVSFVTRLTEQGLYGQVIGLIHRWQKGQLTIEETNFREGTRLSNTPAVRGSSSVVTMRRVFLWRSLQVAETAWLQSGVWLSL